MPINEEIDSDIASVGERRVVEVSLEKRSVGRGSRGAPLRVNSRQGLSMGSFFFLKGYELARDGGVAWRQRETTHWVVLLR